MAIYKDGEKIDEVVKEEATEASIEAMIQKISVIVPSPLFLFCIKRFPSV